MPNRLLHEKSPYLLQHANNPVDWYPWGEEAFTRAQAESKPIFLSIGYSTCHWCHVMERESFENPEIAAQLNRDFVSIKVDREERPDIDRIYMTYVQATTGGGGWPMSVWLTPELRPFVGGTYFPPDNRYGRAGFPLLLERIADSWKKDRERIEESSRNVLAQLQEHVGNAPGAMDASALETAFNYWRRTFDSKLGGFGDAPKFPRPVTLNFLLRYWARTRNREALDMVLATLRAMAKGGMNDQLGGGFHRYSVDEYWFVPHFEKMLYDQAQLAVSYLEAFQITGEPFYADVLRQVLDYVLRDMRHPEGGFYSAEDADSVIDPADPHEKGEGAFYIWTQSEIEEIAGDPAAAKWFCYRYGVEPSGNVRNDPHSEFTGRNILFEAHSTEETAHHFAVDEAAVRIALDRLSARLLEGRAKRVRPHLDDKILAGWNGLMISAFAQAGAVLGDARYTQAARRAADFIATRMLREDVLYRRFREGDTAIPGFLDDYAAFVQALIDLYQTGLDVRDLDLAVRLASRMIELFEDRENGGFYSAGSDANHVMRIKEDYDGAEPSGNSVAALDLLRLAAITGNGEFRAIADRTLAAFARKMSEQAPGLPQMLVAWQWASGKPMQVILAGARESADTRSMLAEVYRRFLPELVIAFAADAGPAAAPMFPVGGRATAYLCENFACQLPTNDARRFGEMLDQLLK